MLKKRVAASLIVRNGIVVQSIGFRKFLPVGKPGIAIEFLNQWGIDEIILLDISKTKYGEKPDFEMIKMASAKCLVPLTVGGGISSIDDIRQLMHCGADKVSFNHALINNPALLSEAAQVFGDQCIIASIDAVKLDDQYMVFDHVKGTATDIRVEQMVDTAQKCRAGEILINSVDRDGSYKGYDLDLINTVCALSDIPVICCGGARNANDFESVFENTSVSAASAANFFHFTEHSVITAKSLLSKKVDIRLETFANYSDAKFDGDLRLLKKPESTLEEMLYMKIEREII